MTGTSTELAERLQQRQARQLAQIEQITAGQLQQLASSLTQQSAAALSTTKNDIKCQHEQLTSMQAELSQLLRQSQETLVELRQLSISESSQIRDGLSQSLKAAHISVIRESVEPLQVTLKALKADASQLQYLTVKAWLKPLIITTSISLGLVLSVILGTLSLDSVISDRVEQLRQLQQKIEILTQQGALIEFGPWCDGKMCVAIDPDSQRWTRNVDGVPLMTPKGY